MDKFILLLCLVPLALAIYIFRVVVTRAEENINRMASVFDETRKYVPVTRADSAPLFIDPNEHVQRDMVGLYRRAYLLPPPDRKHVRYQEVADG